MKTRYLFPNRYKMLGWILLVPSLIVGILMILADQDLFQLEATIFALYDSGFFEPEKAFMLNRNNIADEKRRRIHFSDQAGVVALGYVHQLWLPVILSDVYLWHRIFSGVAFKHAYAVAHFPDPV